MLVVLMHPLHQNHLILQLIYLGLLQLFLILILAFGVHREPTFADTLTLFEYLAYAPKGREGKDTQEDRDIRILHE